MEYHEKQNYMYSTFYSIQRKMELGERKDRDSAFTTIRVYFINLWPQSRKEIDTILGRAKFDKFSLTVRRNAASKRGVRRESGEGRQKEKGRGRRWLRPR